MKIRNLLLCLSIAILVSACAADGTSGDVSSAGDSAKSKTATESVAPAGLICPSGCYSAVCGGINICTQKKPAPLCTPC